MSVAAHLVHATAGRARLRMPSAKGNARFFARVKDELGKLELVRAVKVSPFTASVLVRHSGHFDAVARHAHANDLFDVVEEPSGGGDVGRSPTEARAVEHLRAFLVHADESLRQKTRGTVDLRVVAFGALVSGSAYQLAQGKFLPAGGTMLMQALSLLFGRVRSDE